MTVDDYVSLPWNWNIAAQEEGGYVLTVKELDDFEIYAATAEELRDEYKSALRAHLSAYLAIGKPIPMPSTQTDTFQ